MMLYMYTWCTVRIQRLVCLSQVSLEKPGRYLGLPLTGQSGRCLGLPSSRVSLEKPGRCLGLPSSRVSLEKPGRCLGLPSSRVSLEKPG